MNDSDWLQQFVQTGSEDAFARILEMHVSGVYSTACRVLQDEHLAEEVTQDVFCLLAKKARQLPHDTVLVGWLHRTAWHLAMKALRSKIRRHTREQAAMIMGSETSDSDPLWKQVSPLLDEAIQSLNVNDRHLVLWRYFERKQSREIAMKLGVSEEAARMRLSRAVEKLRDFFVSRGVTCTLAALSTALTANALGTVPPSTLKNIQAAAHLAIQSSVPQSTILNLITIMAQIKIKTALILGTAVLLSYLGAQYHLQQEARGTAGPQTSPAPTGNHQITSQDSPSAQSWREEVLAKRDSAKGAEAEALFKINEILYSTERDIGMPPEEIFQAIQASGSQRRTALDLLLKAYISDYPLARYRAAASLQFFREAADELLPILFETLRQDKDPRLLAAAGQSVFPLRPTAESIPNMMDILKGNPAAGDAVRSWFSIYLFDRNRPEEPVLTHLIPLLESKSHEERFTAATILARTTAKNDPRLAQALIPALNAARSPNGEAQEQALDGLQALKRIGESGRPALQAVLDLDKRIPALHPFVLDALAAIAPELRSEMPELDEKLKAKEAAAAIKEQAAKNEAGVPQLVEALANPEARTSAAEHLGKMGTQAKSSLPRLRELLAAGENDSRHDANNFLFAVATAIRQIDPAAPVYYRPEELTHAFMDVIQHIDSVDPKSPLRQEVEKRMFSSVPYNGKEILDWTEKLEAAGPQAREVFLRSLKRTPSFSNIGTEDPKLAEVLNR